MSITDLDDPWWNSDNPQAQEARHIAQGGHGCIRPTTPSDQTGPEDTPNPDPTPIPTGNNSPTVAAAGPPQIDTTTGTPHTGAMIALIPTTPSAYAIRDGEPPDTLHVTLHYLGEATDIPPTTWDTMNTTLADLATLIPPVQARIFGAAIWNPDTDTPSVIASIGDDRDTGSPVYGLDVIHHTITALVDDVMHMTPTSAAWQPPIQHSPWVAHMCTAYPQPDEDGRDAAATVAALLGTLNLVGPLELGALRITRGAESFDYPLTGARM